MIPSFSYLFSLFNHQIGKLLNVIQCSCHEKDPKVKVSKEVLMRASGASSDDDLVQEISAIVKAGYEEMSECRAALERMVDALSGEVAVPVTPCGELRGALECCYLAHAHQPLHCSHLVAEFVRCARSHALRDHS
ncbi:hypothetical protein HF086_004881 [Spodoptera exigua]|uniref:Uncharacterized protein n=1 Tax=Spodoptera exigua TaxID=7107 RepID=A0A922SM69_SPOEX|nr:hypothetical protein HF086_004881 [Spodoptera exigua]